MANLTSVAQTYDNSGSAITAAYLPANNYKHVISTSDAGRELVISLSKTDITDAEVSTAIRYITTSHGSAGTGDSAFTVAAVGTATGAAFVAGTTDVVYLRVQGTGDLTVGADFGAASSGITAALVAVFAPAK
jgi:hypothetical protein